MIDKITGAALALLSSDSLTKLEALETDIERQAVNLFPIAFAKAERLHSKLKMLENSRAVRLVICSIANLEMACINDARFAEIEYIDTWNYDAIDNLLKSEKKPTIVIFTNNFIPNVGIEQFAKLTSSTQNCLFVMHDYDNHHWYKMSIFGALLSDIYVRAHRHSMPYIDALLPHPTFTVPIGVTQWQRRFLFKSIDKILHAHRTERPGGRHRLYPRFELRNRMIATFALCAPEVGFTDCARFNNQSQEEKLEDWLTTKVQLCAPVGNDIPIRFFDSLITGGLPAIPERSEEAVRGIGVPEEHFISFGPIELANPAATVHAWSERFDKLGQAGIIARLSHCIEHFHIDHTIKKLLHLVFTLASSKQSRDTTTV